MREGGDRREKGEVARRERRGKWWGGVILILLLANGPNIIISEICAHAGIHSCKYVAILTLSSKTFLLFFFFFFIIYLITHNIRSKWKLRRSRTHYTSSCGSDEMGR